MCSHKIVVALRKVAFICLGSGYSHRGHFVGGIVYDAQKRYRRHTRQDVDTPRDGSRLGLAKLNALNNIVNPS